MKLDMHFHSTLSDGRKNSAEILREAKEKWLDFVTFTDHDIIHENVDTIAKALYWIDSCEAVEISSYVENKHLHFTCYAGTFNNRVVEILENTRNWRKQKIDKQIELLQKNWFKIDKEEFYEFYRLKTNIDNLNVSHLAWYIYRFEENIKLIKTIIWEDLTREDFLHRCLKTEWDFNHLGSVVIPEYEPGLELVWGLAKENSAVLSLAHPNYKLTQEEFKAKIWYYMSLWVNAVEINSGATEEWVNLILEYQNKYNYILTFWSDCHFKSYEEDEHSTLWFSNPYVVEKVIDENFKRFKETISRQEANDRCLCKWTIEERLERVRVRANFAKFTDFKRKEEIISNIDRFQSC